MKAFLEVGEAKAFRDNLRSPNMKRGGNSMAIVVRGSGPQRPGGRNGRCGQNDLDAL